MAQQILSTNTFTTAKWIVSATASDGTHTTIASALTSASSGDTIFIRPGTYTENITLKAGVDLTAFPCDSSLTSVSNVIIAGTCTMTTAGTVTITGIQLQTNSAALLAVTGSAASIVNLNGCYLNCTNTTGITFSAANTGSSITLFRCSGNIGTTGISLATVTSTGVLTLSYCFITNSGASTTATTTSTTTIALYYCAVNLVFTTSSTGGLNLVNSFIDSSAVNTTAMTAAGTGTIGGNWSFFSCGSASCISIGTGCTGNFQSCLFNSSNTNVLTGAGSINFAGNLFPGSSQGDNVTTHGTVGTLVGLKGIAPSLGYLGQQIRGLGTAVSISNNTGANVTSVDLTPGVWDVSANYYFTSTLTATAIAMGISTSSASIAGLVYGDNGSQVSNIAASNWCLSVPSFRVTITANTTYFLVQSATLTGTATATGRLSATRVG